MAAGKSKVSVTLLSLPVEIIQRIATLCPPSTVFNLLQVDRRLRASCNTKIVFADISHWYHVQLGISAEPWQPPRLFESATLAHAKRVARAVELVCEWAQMQVSTADDARLAVQQSPHLLEWLPPLIALHHPASWHANVESLFSLVLDHVPEPRWAGEDTWRARFCFAVRVLATLPGTAPFHAKEVIAAIACAPTAQASRVGSLLSEQLHFRPRDYAVLPTRIDTGQSLAIIGAVASAMLQPGALREMPLPDPRRIPFASMTDVALSLCNGNRDYHTDMQSFLTAPVFLSRGEWAGVYNDLRWGDPGQRFGFHDPFMRPMAFSCSAPPESAPAGVCTIMDGSTTYDGHGPFHVRGDVYSDGRVRLQKSYLRGFRWDWCGEVTPLGIAGFWGTEGRDVGGHFWLWKVEWCPPSSRGPGPTG